VVNPLANAAFLNRYSDLPGGGTGEVGLSAMRQVQARSDLYGTDPLQTFTMASKAMQVGTPEGFKTFINTNMKETPQGYNSAYEAFQDKAGWKEVEQAYYAAVKAGNTAVAGRLFKDLISGQPDLNIAANVNPRIQGSVAGGPSSYLDPLIYAGQTGQPNTVTAAAGRRGPSAVPAPPGSFPSEDPNAPSGPRGNLFDEKQVEQYRNTLKNMGMPARMIDATLNAARSRGEDPVELGRFAAAESGFGAAKGGGPGGTGAYGVSPMQNPWQITSGSGHPQPANMEESANYGADVLHWARGMPGGTNLAIRQRLYHGGPLLVPGAEESYQRRFNAATLAGQLPGGQLHQQDTERQRAIGGAEHMFGLSGDLTSALDGLSAMADGFNAFIASMQGAIQTLGTAPGAAANPAPR